MDEKILDEGVKSGLAGIGKEAIKKIVIGAVAVSTLGGVTIASISKPKPVAATAHSEIDSLYAKAEAAYFQEELRRQQAANRPQETWQPDTMPALTGINTLAQTQQPSFAPPPPPPVNTHSMRPQIQPGTQFGYTGGGGVESVESRPTISKNRLEGEYQAIVRHFSETRQLKKWELNESEYRSALNRQDLLNQVEIPLKDLYSGASTAHLNLAIRLPSGTRIIAVTDQDISSDHPGVFTASIIRPYEARGAILVMQSAGNQRDRIPVQALKIVSKNNKESAITGQAMMGFPGFSGNVKSHWAKRMGPAIVNAAIGGGFLAWSMAGPDEGRVDTRDVIVSEVVGQSVSGLQNEISRLGGDYPNTVTVKAGTQFEILLTSEVVIEQ